MLLGGGFPEKSHSIGLAPPELSSCSPRAVRGAQHLCRVSSESVRMDPVGRESPFPAGLALCSGKSPGGPAV